MESVAAIGGDYLWVDSLCIIQDIKAVKYHQISSISAIYSKCSGYCCRCSRTQCRCRFTRRTLNTRVVQVVGDACGLRSETISKSR